MNSKENKELLFLKQKKFFASKKLGQNFLTNETIKKNIVDALKINNNENVIEIGPGLGAITKYILLRTQNLKIIEVDKRLVEFLKTNFKDLQIISSDVLKVDLNALGFDNYKIISNLPYSISAKVIFKILKESNFSVAVLMVQKEMADRITAKPNTKKYNNFTVLLSLTTNIEKLFDVSNTCFYPIPEVASTVIRMNRKAEFKMQYFDALEKFLFICFNQRRKTIVNNLRHQFDEQKIKSILDQMKINIQSRPQTISPQQYWEMFLKFYEI
ncbi:MAG: ribosomal RNA small subunit methyltransferase A [Malacoplasma sp.]|nr:ribosomal RNA small subunit methyltransferase A [Malacoplasma sp.]